MLRARRFGRDKDIVFRFTRYGLKDFRVPKAPEVFQEDMGPEKADVEARAKAFAQELKRSGPAFVMFV